MMTDSERPGPIRHVLGTLWNGITRIRLAISNLLFLLIIILIFLAFRGQTPEPLPDRAALLLNPVGSVVEQKSYVEPLAVLLEERSPQEREVLLSDMVDAILMAKDDPKISALIMELDQLFSIGTSKSGEVAEAIAEFRATGKPVITWTDSLSQDQYLLASEADELIIHPMGGVVLEGFSNYQWYFADALEKLRVNVHVFRAGEFKSIAEPFMRNDMSEGEKEISRRWLESAWSHYTARIEARRELPEGAIDTYITSFPETMKENNGDMAAVALAGGLVDKVMLHADANSYIADVVGATNDQGFYEAVDFEYYLDRRQPGLEAVLGKPQVAVIPARGNILGGEQPAGTIGSGTLGPLIRDAAEDPDVAAIVVRVDSGGGSTFASELIRQQILEARESGKPVVVSMGSIAASGGYWIASAADQVWATPTTLTGSIGVFLALPTFEGLLDRAGINTDGVGTTEFAGAYRPDRPIQPQVSKTYQAAVDHYHDMFIDIISAGRGMSAEDVRPLANGGVYLGEYAKELGLVDELGDRRGAIEAAAGLAGLEEGDFVPVIYEETPSPRDMFLRQLAGDAQSLFGSLQPSWQATLRSWGEPLRAGLSVLENLDDPRNIYAHCLVCLAP
jgi:protease-4